MFWLHGLAGVPAAGDHRNSTERYKDRNQIERAFNRLKQFRAVATRYDKLRARYHATVTIASIMIWLRARPDRRRHDPSDSL